MIGDWNDDWELLNAYADGELDPAVARAVETRLKSDPDLRRELSRLRDLKKELAVLRPLVADSAAPQPADVPSRWRPFAVSAAAALLVVALGAAALMAWPAEQPTLLARASMLHDQLSQETYVVDEGYVSRIVSSGQDLEFRAPDLTTSRLYLVDVVTSADDDRGEAIAMHYRGMRGCRLTVVAFPAAGSPSRQIGADALNYIWSYGGFDFAVIARGMDAERFASVAAYVEAEIVDGMRRHDDLRIAMAQRYDAAQPCA